MKIRSARLNELCGTAAASVVQLWTSTLESKVAYYDPSVDPVHPDYHGQKIYIFWHEYILLPLSLRAHCNLAMLLSRHNDAEILSHAARRLGFDFVRGSTSRGGVAALRSLVHKSRTMNLTITPDGPRGPRRVMAPGPVYLASRLGLPLVLLGLGCDRPWRLRSWDRFAIPRPFSRARAVVSPALSVPRDLDREGIERYTRRVERLLNRLSAEAEAWAEFGTHKIGEWRAGPAVGPRRARQIATAALVCPQMNGERGHKPPGFFENADGPKRDTHVVHLP